MTLSDPLQLSDPQRLPPKEVCWRRPLTLQFPGPPQNKARGVPSGAELTARTNTLSEEEQRLETSSNVCLFGKICVKREKKGRKDLKKGHTVNKRLA